MIVVKDVVLQIEIIYPFMNLTIDQALVFHHRHNCGTAFYEIIKALNDLSARRLINSHVES